ncbi:uncharacterized protein LOC126746461 [Anthonomus grandis grandis]|uniref:uncharacterized protein LOC126746461 n=1 Tax=Anthonomus grandis grandis TaxID=2921223 RepID=UPI00216649C6|nr:uncharacterized protein LOC126746461 [Anthonomus grandis grandis]
MYVNQSSVHHPDLSNAHHGLHEGETTRTFRLATFIISIPLCLLAILIDLLLIFVILKYKAFKSRGNYYILHFAICNVVFLAAEHVLHLSMDLFFGGSIEVQYYCTFIQMENYFLDMCVIFLAGYALDEYIVMISSDYFLYMYKNGFRYVLGAVYPVHFILSFIVTSVCFSNIYDIRFHVSFIFVTVVYVVCMAVLIKIRYDCRKSFFNKNQNLVQSLHVTLFAMLFLLPVIFYYNVLNLAEKIVVADSDMEVLRVIAVVPEYLAYATSMALIYKLYKHKKFYKLAVCKVFCKAKSNELDFTRLDVLPPTDIENK